METATENSEKIDTCETPHLFLFGQPILTEQQMSRDRSSNDGPEEENITGKKMVSPSSSRSCSKSPADDFDGSEITELGSDTGHCLVIMESEAVGRSLDLSRLGSYDELYRMLAKMFDKSETPAHVLYQDATGCTKHAGDEPFSIFMKTAKTIRILKGANGKSIGSNRAEGLTYGEN